MAGRPERWWTALVVVCLVALAFAPAAQAAFPGQNGKLVFYRYVSPSWDVYVINADGTGETNLTSSQAGDQENPSWSPDGSKIAYSRSVTNVGVGIWVMNADGSGKVEVAPHSSQRGFAQFPSWSPDGSKLVFTRTTCVTLDDRDYCTPELHTINSDGTGEEALGAKGIVAAWSPDGQRIAFDYCPDRFRCEEPQVLTIRSDGSDQQDLTPFGITDSSPDWSPNGARLIFTSLDQTEGVSRLWTMDPDGSNRSLVSGTENSGGAVWSPDGTRITFVGAGLPQGLGIYTMAVDGTDVSFVAPGWRPGWQPIPGPRRADYKNGAAFCGAERDFLGEQQFRATYGRNGHGANAFGKCVSGK